MAETLATAPDIPPGLLQKLSQLSQHVSLWLIVAHLERSVKQLLVYYRAVMGHLSHLLTGMLL